MRSWNLVDDFFADPTGVANSASAFENGNQAMSHGDLMLIPHGHYLHFGQEGPTVWGLGKQWIGIGKPVIDCGQKAMFGLTGEVEDVRFENLEFVNGRWAAFSERDLVSLNGYDFHNITVRDGDTSAFLLGNADCNDGRVSYLKLRNCNRNTGFYGVYFGKRNAGNSGLDLDHINLQDCSGTASSYGLFLRVDDVNASNIRIKRLSARIGHGDQTQGTVNYDICEGIRFGGRSANLTNFLLEDAGTSIQINLKADSERGRTVIGNGTIRNVDQLTMDNTIAFNQGTVKLHDVWFDQVRVSDELRDPVVCGIRSRSNGDWMHDAVEIRDNTFLMPEIEDKRGSRRPMYQWLNDTRADYGGNHIYQRLQV